MATLCSNLKCIHETLIKERKCNGLISVYSTIYMLFFLSLFCFYHYFIAILPIPTDIIFINNSLMLLIINTIVNWVKSEADGVMLQKTFEIRFNRASFFCGVF